MEVHNPPTNFLGSFTSDPSTAQEGQQYFNTSTHKMRTYISAAWADADGQTTITGNAGTATALQTARKISGVSFDGTADIDVTNNILLYQALGSAIKAENYPHATMNTSAALVDGRATFYALYLPKAATITGVKWYQNTQGNFTADNNNKIGLYTYSAGTLTLVASCANDANLLKAASAAYVSKAFSSTYAASAGLLFVCFLYNSSAEVTSPALGQRPVPHAATATFDYTNSGKTAGYVTSQTDLPSSQACSGLTSENNAAWVSLY